jgi:hypothetical protein
MFCDVNVPKLGVLSTRFVFREVIVTSSSESNIFLRHSLASTPHQLDGASHRDD